MPTPATSRPPPSPTASPGKWPDNGEETDMSILTGEALVLGTFVPYQWLNYIKNNWRGATLDDVVPGMIQSNEADDKLYHYIAGSGGASEEVLQETKSADVSPMFNGVILDGKWAGAS